MFRIKSYNSYKNLLKMKNNAYASLHKNVYYIHLILILNS